MEHQPRPQIPDKLYFKIGEVSAITGLPTYVLRFWETQFTKIKPKRTSSGQRLYRKNDVEVILTIKSLLHEKKFTIKGAVQHLKTNSPVKKRPSSTDTLKEIRLELESLRSMLGNWKNKEPILKRPLSKSALICPISASGSNFNPRNTPYIPVDKIIAFLDLEQNWTFWNCL